MEDEMFVNKILEAQKLCESKKIDLAELCDVSEPTLKRWLTGRNLPHRLMRNKILSRLENIQ